MTLKFTDELAADRFLIWVAQNKGRATFGNIAMECGLESMQLGTPYVFGEGTLNTIDKLRDLELITTHETYGMDLIVDLTFKGLWRYHSVLKETRLIFFKLS